MVRMSPVFVSPLLITKQWITPERSEVRSDQ